MTAPAVETLEREKDKLYLTDAELNVFSMDSRTNFGNPYVIGDKMDMKMVRRWGWNISPEGQKMGIIYLTPDNSSGSYLLMQRAIPPQPRGGCYAG